MTTHSASVNPEWNYFGMDEDPPLGKIQILTRGGVSVTGDKGTADAIAWAPLLKRNKLKERIIALHAGLPREAVQAKYQEALAAYRDAAKLRALAKEEALESRYG